MNKYYVTTPFYRSIEENKAAFVEAQTGAEAAAKVLGGNWRIKNPDGVALENMAMVYKLKSFDLIGSPARIDALSIRHYERS